MQAPTSVAKPAASSPVLVLKQDLQARWRPTVEAWEQHKLEVARYGKVWQKIWYIIEDFHCVKQSL